MRCVSIVILAIRCLIGCVLSSVLAGQGVAQEQIDKGDPSKAGPLSPTQLTVRVRVVKVSPPQKTVQVKWRRGGMGLGGMVISGKFSSQAKGDDIGVGDWSATLPLLELAGKSGWAYPNLLIDAPLDDKKKRATLTEVAVEFEFSDKEKPFKQFVEGSPQGNNVSITVHWGAADRKTFDAELLPLSRHVRKRRELVEKMFPEAGTLPKKFALLGNLGGYGPGAGFGIRHNNPEIVADECRTQLALGFNGMVGKKALEQADAAGFGDGFGLLAFGGPGAGSPMNFFKKDKDGCPFDPALKKFMAERTAAALEDHQKTKARESWAEWVDEIGVAAKEHHQTCPRCRAEYHEYLKANGVAPADVGQASWDRVAPFPLWTTAPKAKGPVLAKAPKDKHDALNYYYSFRFMTHATAKLFPEAAAEFAKAKVPMFAMQGPTPSWNGSSLDWFEFYDAKANTAAVWETSNRDPRVWQLESYLADIMRGIAQRLQLFIGTLVKPHRGAPEQRLLAAVTRGARAIEWYTYGPDYARGDSFSQRPDLLERVGKVNRFLGAAEDWLYDTKWAGKPEVAFVSPRSSEIWGKATPLGVTAFEDAKWVYLALQHAHIPVDILSEQQLAEGKLSQYKAIYVVGPNLHHKAYAKLRPWVEAGGVLWTDALGLSRDEANQPITDFGMDRQLESWGSVDGYRAVTLTPLKEKEVPAHAKLTWSAGGAWGKGEGQAGIGRESLLVAKGEVLARFADDKPAVVRHSLGQGKVVMVGMWAGLTYSAKVRRPDYDMRADFDPNLRNLIAAAALDSKIYRPVIPADALVEAVYQVKDGKRSIALMNWAFRHDTAKTGPKYRLQPVQDLRIELPGLGTFQSVRSQTHGKLAIDRAGACPAVALPRLDAIDLLTIE